MVAPRSLDLRSFKIPLGKLAAQESFRTRQGDVLSYRIYPAWSENLIVLYHGVGGDSRYLCVLASALAEAGAATVVTPDFRGHGLSLGLSDQISDSQLEIDLEELLIHIKMKHAIQRIILGGHSLGGGFALKVAVSESRQQFAGFLALAPYLPPSLGTFYEGFGNWILPDSEGGFSVNMPAAFRTGQEKLQYSASYLKAVSPPGDIFEKMRELHPPMICLTGDLDEVVRAEIQKELFEAAGIPIRILRDLNHLSIVTRPNTTLPAINNSFIFGQ